MLEIVSTGSYHAAVSDQDAGLQDLRRLVKNECRGHYRRIDRFIQMSLLGAARCLGAQSVDRDMALYLGSGDGPMANNVQVQQQIVRDGQLPKPANFINTLSNSAGYYVARSLGLTSRNLFVSQGVSTLDALLQLAMVDLQLGKVGQALVGVTDECVLPLDTHRARIGAAAGTALAEGSHWFLLRGRRHGTSNSAASCEALATIRSVELCLDDTHLERWLGDQARLASECYLAPQSSGLHDLADRLAGRQLQRFEPALGHYASRSAGALSEFLQSGGAGASLLSVFRDGYGRSHVSHIARNR